MIFPKLRSYPKDIQKLFFVAFTQGLIFFLPILALYYEENLFNLSNVVLILGIGALTLAIMEVPSGSLADLWGRKNTMIISKILTISSLIFLLIGGSFLMILLHAILRNIGRSLKSGTDASMMYDILQEKNQTNKFKKIYGTYFSLWAIGATIASVIGGHLATINMRIPIALTGVPLIIGLFLILTIKEPKYKKSNHKNILRQIKESLKTIISKKQLIILFAGFMLIFGFGEAIHDMLPIFLNFKEIPLYLFGYGAALAFGTSAIGHYLSHDISEKLGNKKTLIISSIGSAIMVYLATIIPYIGAMIIYSSASFFYGIRSTLKGHLINVEIESSQRATIMSIDSLLRFVSMAFIMILFSKITNIINVNGIFKIASLGILMGAIIFLWIKDK